VVDVLVVSVTISIMMHLITHSLNNRPCPPTAVIMPWCAVDQGLPFFPHPHHQLLLKVEDSLLYDKDKSKAKDNREWRYRKSHFHAILSLDITEHLLENLLDIRYKVKEASAHEDSAREARRKGDDRTPPAS